MTTIPLLSSLQYAKFRLLWGNLFLTQVYFFAQNVIVSFSVLRSTNSFWDLGIIMALNSGPSAFGLMSGTFADRVSKRKIVVSLTLAQLILSLALAFVISGQQPGFLIIALIVFLSSTITSLSQPAAYAMMADIVEPRDIANATSLTRLSLYLAGVTGPAIVGIIANTVGLGTLLYFNSAFVFVALMLVVVMGEVPASHLLEVRSRNSLVSNLREGFSYSWKVKAIFGGQMVWCVSCSYVWASFFTLIPILSTLVLGQNASGLGWLYTAYNLGGLFGNIILASARIKHRGRLLSATSYMLAICLILMASSVVFTVTFVVLVFMGIAGSLTLTLATIVILSNASEGFRGRVMGLQTLYTSFNAPGGLIAVWITIQIGVVKAYYVEASLFMVTMALLLFFVPELRRAT